MTTIKELITYLDKNKEKIFEISFGGYWMQVPFGLIGDMVKKMIDYAKEDNHEEDDLGCPCPYESDYACANCIELLGEQE